MKRYKEFITESNSWNYSHEELKEMVSTCEDILLDLKDEYFNTNIHFSYNAWIKFYISRPEEFTYSDISEVIETLKSYLKNFELEIEWNSPDELRNNQPTIKRTSIMNPMTFVPDGLKSGCEIYFVSTKECV